MNVVWNLDDHVAGVVSRQLGHSVPRGTTMGFEVDGAIVGGMVFHGWKPEKGIVEVTIASASPRWMTRTILNDAADYVFGQLQCQVLIARTDPANRSVRFWRALRASEATIEHGRGLNRPEVVFTLTEAQARQSKFAR